MAQNRFINITKDPNVGSKADRKDDNHTKGLGAAAAGDLTLSFDATSITSFSVLRSMVKAALDQAQTSMSP